MGGPRHRPRRAPAVARRVLELRLRGEGPHRRRPARLVRGDAHSPRRSRLDGAASGDGGPPQPVPLPGTSREPEVHQLADGEQRELPHPGSLRPPPPGELRLGRLTLDGLWLLLVLAITGAGVWLASS